MGWELIAICILTAINLVVTLLTRKPAKIPELPKIPAPQVTVNLDPLQRSIDSLPTKVLQSIQGSVNAKRGALGELIGLIQLKAEYDRIIPLGNIVDFVCIKFPEEGDPGSGKIDFVDVKTGKTARLSTDQKALQQLIMKKKIGFVKLKVDLQ